MLACKAARGKYAVVCDLNRHIFLYLHTKRTWLKQGRVVLWPPPPQVQSIADMQQGGNGAPHVNAKTETVNSTLRVSAPRPVD